MIDNLVDGSPAAPLLEVRDLVVAGRGGFRLGPVSLSVHPRELIGVLGPAGAGKTLLLRALAGLATPVDGTISWSDPDQARVGFAFQQGALLPELTALENVRLALPPELDEDEARSRSQDMLSALALAQDAEKRPGALSGGMRRRVGLARALVADPPLLLLDDATAGLDPSTGAEVMERLLLQLEHSRAAAVMTTHDVDTVLPRASTALLLDGGTTRHQGSPASLAAVTTTAAYAPKADSLWTS